MLPPLPAPQQAPSPALGALDERRRRRREALLAAGRGGQEGESGATAAIPGSAIRYVSDGHSVAGAKVDSKDHLGGECDLCQYLEPLSAGTIS
eukprot:245468-Rhodomonas_salina.3